MGVTSFTHEFSSSVPAPRLFKALFLDSHTLLPKLLPQKIKSVEFIEGDGGAETISQINFVEGSQFKFFKHKIDAVDKENLAYKYTLIEGDVIGDKIEKIAYDVKCEASNDGGCVCKMTCKYHTVGEFEMKEEEIMAGNEKGMALYKVMEAYLLQNPEAYA
nr:pathogenesis-related protein [Platanus x hispanica]